MLSLDFVVHKYIIERYALMSDALRMATKYRYNQMLEPTNRENKRVLEGAENICTSLPDMPG